MCVAQTVSLFTFQMKALVRFHINPISKLIFTTFNP